MFKKVESKVSFPKMEEEVLKFWEENKIFEKSLEIREGANRYNFYDGPPFATGTPHYGHLVGNVMKDVVPRYWTMKGFQVERKWGWDCHGLPIENIAEKELGISNKTEIEDLGIEKFNETCRSKVLGYVKEWETVIGRLGRWADMKNAYRTMDPSFMESVWWVFKELYEKGLIYEGYRSMHVCPRCETTLSQSEVAEGYKDIKDLSVIAKFELEDELDTFVLAWTTTPWTLIGNVALAVGEKINYVKVEFENKKYILAKDRLEEVFKEKEYKIIEEIEGRELIGKKYKSLFDYYSSKEDLENKENGWKIYSADFVTTEDGTGIVHIAPAFGEDDLELGKKHDLPFVQHLKMDGIIKEEAKDLAGLSVKPKDDHQKTDVEIIKYLAGKELLFAKEKYEHSYPHCWRCDTPLINYATSSWFVSVEKIKDKALKLAENINWTPDHLKEGRFGNWLEGARDWSISRQRYWASVMPIWKCEKCEELKVIGSIEEMGEGLGNPNRLFLIRHGEAETNTQRILSSALNNGTFHLTEYGRKKVFELAESLKNEKIDMIFASPILRTRETAEIISKALGDMEINFDERLVEWGMGDLEGKKVEEFGKIFKNWPEEDEETRKKFSVETEKESGKRWGEFIDELNKKYKNKNIIIVSHGDPLHFLNSMIQEEDRVESYKNGWYPEKASLKVIYSKKIDLHKDSIDKITLKCEKCEGEMKRIPDVLDTWFDSGSMPYAQAHYPFENKEKFEAGFPAEFIAEGVDQTRCWFYYLHMIATGVKKSQAFNNVVVNGIVLAEDGKKMSKRLNNYPDPSEIFEKYGADALRFYLMSAPVVAAENMNFKESDVADNIRGIFRMLWNSYSFFVLYANIDKFEPKEGSSTENLLDKWIISELQTLIRDFDQNMENYELNKAIRLVPRFVDNLSNWYIRRSRKRFWKSEDDNDKENAYQTLWTVLTELSKVMAPFTPFIAEEIYKNLTGKESVHLEDFPVADEKLIDEKLNQEMEMARNVITQSLQLRAKAGIKVRQPLQEITVKNKIYSEELVEIVKDELNIKKVEFNLDLNETVTLNTEISEELKLEGQAREIIRFIQEMRKEAGYEVENRISVGISGGEKVLGSFSEMIKKEVLGNELKTEVLEISDLEKEFEIDGEKIKISIKK